MSNQLRMQKAMDTKDAAVINQTGIELAAEGFYEDAIDLLGEGLCMFPFDEKLRGSRGRKYIGAFNYMASIADLSLATRLNPNDWEHWYYMGVAAYLGGKYELAKDCHKNSRELMIKYNIEAIPATVDWYWMACMKLGQKEEAEKG